MTWEFAFRPAARAEPRDAVRYYEAANARLGARFAAEVGTVVESILDQPNAGAAIDPGVRRRLLNRFPYNVIYLSDADSLLIVAIMHRRRKPGYWAARIDRP